MDATYATQIQSEDLLNINDLDSPSEGQRERIRSKIEDLFKGKIESDSDWADRNRNTPYDEIINNIKDWIDPDTQGSNGGEESSIYSRVRELDPDAQDRFPPNRFFRTMDEVRMVPGVTDEIFELISPSFSVFGPMGINPNLADQNTIKALHFSFTDEIVAKIMNRRNDPNEGGPFADAKAFFDYVDSIGARITEEEKKRIPLRFTNPCNFRIQSTGSSGKSVITITAVTYDIACAQAEVSKNIAQDKTKGDDQTPPEDKDSKESPTKDGSSDKQELPKGPPRIVYWNER
jgi:general secretion pathway protein K